MKILPLCLLLLFSCKLTMALPVIAEFMASNTTTLKDGHGDYADWVEIWNPDSVPVDLAGWRLTDSANNPGKFVFPSKILPAGGRIVVFCSGRAGSTGAAAHVDKDGFLHTNFELSKSGEYLALVSADGTQRPTEFAPFPQQVTDLSFGSRGAFEPLINETTALRYLVPTSSAADTATTNWRAIGYSDTSWKTGTGSGVGFEAGSPVGVWLFDEAAGSASALDATGSGHAALLDGSGQIFGAGGYGPDPNTALALDGRGGLRVPFSGKLNPPGAFSFAAWVYPADGTGYRTVVSSSTRVSGQLRGFSLSITPANTWEFWTGTGTVAHLLAGGPATLNTWTHIAISRSAAGVKRLFVNGVQAAGVTGGYAPMVDPSHGFYLGAGDDTGSTYRWTGRFDDAAFFAAELSPLMVQQHRDHGAASFPTPLYPAHYQNDVQALVASVSTGLYTRHRFNIADKTLLASLRLRVKYDDAFVAWVNGVEVSRGNFSGERAFDSVAATDRADTSAVVFSEVDISANALPALVNGVNVLAIHGFRRSLANEDFLLSPVLEAGLLPAAQLNGHFAVPTPGSANDALTISPGPDITEVKHAPMDPLQGQTVTVTAHIIPRLGPIADVSLIPRVMYTPESPAIPMSDAGPVPGATDGSRLFTADIPNTGGATTRRMLRYYITATDTSSRTWRAPYPVDLTNADGISQSPQFFGLVVKDPALVAGMPVMQWFTSDVGNSDTRTGSRASAFYGGHFYDNIYVRQRGGYTSAGSQKFNFNAGEGVYVNEKLGRVGEVNLNGSGVDPNYYRVAGSYEMLRTSGHPGCEAFDVLLYRNAAFQRMAVLIEQVDEDYLKRWGYDPDGAMYKFVQRIGETPIGNDYSNNPAFGDILYGIEKKTRIHEGMADLEQFVAGLNTGTPATKKAHLFSSLNLPNFINFMAMRPVIADSDTNRKNFYFYRDSDDSREWYLFPWDKDGTMNRTINPWQATVAYKAEAGTTNQWNVLWEQAYQSLEIRAMVGRRIRTLMDTLLGPIGTPAGTSLIEQRMAVVRFTMTPLPAGVSISNYNNISTWNSWLTQNRTALYNTYGPSGTFKMIPAAAGPDPAIVFESIDPNPASGTQDLEHLVLKNAGAEAVDLSGWTLTGGGINHTFKSGTVIVGTSTSTLLNRAYVCNHRAAFRSRAGAAVPEFVLGNYDGALSARGGTLELRTGAGVLISSITLPAAPTAGQLQLRITKLMYAPSGPTRGELTALPAVEAEDFAYLEVRNIGPTALNLGGYRFTDGINFTFPPNTQLAAGARLVLTANPTAFDLRYGSGLNRIGPYAGALDNSGERVRLVDAVGEEILDFSYSPSWFPSSDGRGYALVIRDDTTGYASWTLPENWALSGTHDGNPGTSPAGFTYEFEGWKNYVFNAADRANASISGPSVVNNTAGLSNLLAFALTADPHAPDLGLLPELTSVKAGDTYAALRLRRWKNSPGLTYSLEAASSPDDAVWQAVGVLHENIDNSDGTTTITLRDTLPAGARARRFLRLRVSLL